MRALDRALLGLAHSRPRSAPSTRLSRAGRRRPVSCAARSRTAVTRPRSGRSSSCARRALRRRSASATTGTTGRSRSTVSPTGRTGPRSAATATRPSSSPGSRCVRRFARWSRSCSCAERRRGTASRRGRRGDASLAGTVRIAGGAPARRGAREAHAPRRRRRCAHGLLTDGAGAFSVPQLQAGRWRLDVQGAGLLPLRAELDLVGDVALEAQLATQPAQLPAPAAGSDRARGRDPARRAPSG